MKITEFRADQVIVRFDLGFDYETQDVEDAVHRHQHRLTTEGFSILTTGRRDTLGGVSITIEATRFVGKDDLDG
jgi:hypothetical protein